MAAIAELPLPTPTRSLAAAVRKGALRDGASTILVAWHLATVRTWPVAPRVRARSFALVFAVAALLATGSLATAAAVRVVLPPGWEHERIIDRTGSGVMLPVGDPSSGAAPEPSPSAEPSDGPRADLPPTVAGGGADPTTGDSSGATKDDGASDDRDEAAGTSSDDHPETDDGDRSDSGDGGSSADPEGSQATPEPVGESGGGGAPDATPEPDHDSSAGEAPDATPEPDHQSDSGTSGTSDGGTTEPDH